MEDMAKDTDNGCRQCLQAGRMTLQGHNYPTDREKRQWPQALQMAFNNQTDIGWEQVLHGRIAKSWKRVVTTQDTDRGDDFSDPWVRKMIRLNWKFGMDIWTFRNELIHGTDGPALRTEGTHTKELIKDLYRYIRPRVERGRDALFPTEESHLEHHSRINPKLRG